MARITMGNSQKATFAEVFELYISAVTARGVKDKTLATYKQHFHAISKRLDRESTPTEIDHVLCWIEYDQLKGKMFVEMQNWALEQLFVCVK